MRNKILIIEPNQEDQERLEEILQGVVENGGELFFSPDRTSGLELLHKEQPQLVFLESSLVGEKEDEWIHDGVHIVLMRYEGELEQKSEDFVLKPFQETQILEKCQAALSSLEAPPIPPM